MIPSDGKTSIAFQNACTSGISVSVEDASAKSLGNTSISSNKSSTYDITLSKGTYYLKVAQGSDAAQGAYTFTISHNATAATAAPSPSPSNTTKVGKVKITSVKHNAPKRVIITWKKLSNVHGYQVQISTKKNFKKITVSKLFSSSTSTVTYHWHKKKTYYVRVRAYIIANGSTKYGKWSAKKKIKTKKKSGSKTTSVKAKKYGYVGGAGYQDFNIKYKGHNLYLKGYAWKTKDGRYPESSSTKKKKINKAFKLTNNCKIEVGTDPIITFKFKDKAKVRKYCGQENTWFSAPSVIVFVKGNTATSFSLGS